MSNSLFPTNIPGLSWEYTISELFDNVYYPSATPGVESALSKSADPTFRLKLNYTFLREDANGTDELAILKGFWRKMQGGFDSFLVDLSAITKREADGTIAGQVLAVDGNNYAPLVRTYGGVDETIFEVNAIADVYDNGVAVPAGTVNTAPASGHYTMWTSTGQRTYGGASYPGVVLQFGTTPTGPVTADFSWYYRMRFDKGQPDQADFEGFLFQLYDMQEIDLVTRRNP